MSPAANRPAGAEPVVLAVDLGTSEVKGGLVAADGSVRASVRVAYGIEVEAGSGRAEQDPEAWWAAFRTVCHSLLANGAGAGVAAICCVGQGPTLTPVDADGRPTHAALTWMDGRADEEAAELAAATGLSGWGLAVLPAALWLERHAPRDAARTRWYLNAWEWLILRLTGSAVRTRSPGQVVPDPSAAARTGLAAERVPGVVEAGSIVGRVGGAVAAELGLPAGTPVVAGTVDSFASFHGAGLRDPGDAVDTGGTSGGLAVYWDAEVPVEGTWVAPAPLPGRWLYGGAMNATGKALSWLDEQILAGRPGAQALIAEAARVPPGADGLVFLPYLAGERSPIWDPQARGALVGLTLGHGRAHVTRAILEAAALALRHVARPILAAGLRIDELVVTGGTARDDTWNRIKADVLGVPVAVPAERETAVLGAAILAATGIGWQPDVAAAIGCMVRIDHRLEPDPANRATYDALFRAYVDLWPAIRPIVRGLHQPPRALGG